MFLSFFYRGIVSFRNLLFDWEVLPSKDYDIPIISVGNITVGGTGKTPHIEYLIELFAPKYKIAVLSRGYKRKSKGFVLGNESSTVAELGDEPYQMLCKYPQAIIAVDANRRRGIAELQKQYPDLDLILLDDAFQHRYVRAGLSIVLCDFNRPVYEDKMLPSGNLREPFHALKRADVVVVTKCPPTIKPMECHLIEGALNLFNFQKVFFSTLVYGDLQPLDKTMPSIPLTAIQKEQPILLVTGIATPAPLIAELEKYTNQITHLAYPDHHNFTAKDILKMENAFERLTGENPLIVTTEKDAMRLLAQPIFADKLQSSTFFVPLHIQIQKNLTQEFNLKIESYVKNNQRNSTLHRN